ncbi:unnamed protein product [Phytophthora lilii]|uniref:Unnamed protein product n=1 Tax=Phytophthora lilii TaxID=2077276 RepID=A0A9W6WT44_9STRA|nr:unnamed protein product [Phytophthora lilii]
MEKFLPDDTEGFVLNGQIIGPSCTQMICVQAPTVEESEDASPFTPEAECSHGTDTPAEVHAVGALRGQSSQWYGDRNTRVLVDLAVKHGSLNSTKSSVVYETDVHDAILGRGWIARTLDYWHSNTEEARWPRCLVEHWRVMILPSLDIKGVQMDCQDATASTELSGVTERV